MAKKRIVGQSGQQNRAGASRDISSRNKKIMKTITGSRTNESAFKGSKSIKTILNKAQGKGTDVLLHTGYSQGNLGGAIISNVQGNKKMKNVSLVYGVKDGGAVVYDYGQRAKGDVKGWLDASRNLFHDKEYKQLMKETGGKVHGSLTMANKIMGLQVGPNGTKLGNDFVTATSYDKNGKKIKVVQGPRYSVTGTGQNPSEVVTNVGGSKVSVTQEQFRQIRTSNLNPEDWNNMSSSQKFLTLAKMSSPSFKADKANQYAKKMETRAKNISRGVGIAGKAIGEIGRGIGRGYGRGWGMR